MAASSDARALARRLAASDPTSLARLLHARGVPSSTSWRDCFDAAEGLLDAASIDRTLFALPRTLLRTIASAGTGASDRAGGESASAALRALALVDDDGMPFTAVTARMRDALSTHPDAIQVPPDPRPPASADARTEAALAERAADSVRALADLLAHARQSPVTVTGHGAVTAVERRALQTAGIVSGTKHLDDLLSLGSQAGLVARHERTWRVTTTAAEWLSQPLTARWQAVARAWRAHLPAALRTSDGGYLPPSGWDPVYPLDEGWPERAHLLRRRARRWAILGFGHSAGNSAEEHSAADEHSTAEPSVTDGAAGIEPAWAAPFRAGADADLEALAAHLPPEIENIYLQADLTAIAPGPLRSDLDLRLRLMAVRESHAQASTYRFTAQTVTAALSRGESAQSLREFLNTLSLTGIPQPLDYLIEQVSARYGLVRVGTDAASGLTRVSSSDRQLLRTIAVDQSVRAAGFAESAAGADALSSHLERDAVYWLLADAHYPVAAVDASGSIQPLTRDLPPIAASDPDDAALALLPLAELLLDNSGGDAEAAWLERELERAVRTRSHVTVHVRMPDGTDRQFTLEATGMGGGRLRGRDYGTDIERTLPVGNIVSVQPA